MRALMLILGLSLMALPHPLTAGNALLHRTQATESDIQTMRAKLRSVAGEATADRDKILGATRKGGPSPLQDKAIRDVLEQRLETYKTIAAPFFETDDQDAQNAVKAIQKLIEAQKVEYGRVRDQFKRLGEVKARLGEIEAQIGASATASPVPDPLEAPFTATRIGDWGKAAASARKAAEKNRAAIVKVTALLYRAEAFEALDKTQAETLAQIRLNARPALKALEASIPEDPTAPSVLKPFFDAGDPSGAHAMLDEARTATELAIGVDEATGRDPTARAKLLGRIETARAAFDKTFRSERLPEPKSSDPERLVIARQILAIPKYGFGEAGPVVLTTPDVITREHKESETTFTDAQVGGSGDITLTGTETTWTYRWNEFKFAVPLTDKASGDWYIWWITAKNFSSGGAKTPIGTWVSGKAHKGSRILRGNFE